MSTLNVSNITDGTTTLATEYVVNGSAKAYIAYSVASGALDSFNISSTLDENGTIVGQYTHNLTNAMSQNNYSVITSSTFTSSDRFPTGSTILTTSYTTYVWDASTPSRLDGSRSSAIFGDLA